MLEQVGLLPLFIKENITADEGDRIEKAYQKTGKDALLKEATARKVIPFVARTCVALDLDADFWSERLEDYRERNRKILAMLDRVYQTLEKHGVRKMFVTENVGALLSANGDIGLFASGDVDNCADVSERDKIYSAFEELGFERKERFALRNQISCSFHPHDAEIGDAFYINVDFHPLARLKLPCFVDADDFVDWDALYTYGDTAIKLPPPDALMYICLLHISLHSFSRAPDARLYLDIIHMAKCPIHYESLGEWAARDHTQTRLATAGMIAKTLFDVDIPGWLLKRQGANAVLKQVYDMTGNDLIYEPHGLKVLWIELLCDDIGWWHGLKEMAFPNKEWVAATYGGAGVLAYLKHMLRILP
ncbi:MAG: hypothetical protein IJC17_04030 [Clostridia bacterium]|nr:hypothetical protein [Clostridia bacterium]